MAAGSATRMAGKAMSEFFKIGLPLVSSSVEQAVLNKLVEKYSPKEVPYQGPLPRRGNKNVYIPGHPLYGESTGLGTVTETPEAASSRIGKIVTKLGPENIAKVTGTVAPLAAAGTAVVGAGLLNQALQQPSNVYAQSQYSLPVQKTDTPVSYANQRYTPGMSPMTNQAIAESILEQQKFEHQLQLIQARQAAQQGAGSLPGASGSGLDIMRLSNQVFAPVSY